MDCDDDQRKCPACDQWVYEDTEQCPHCGEWIVVRLESSNRAWRILVVLLLIALLLIAVL